MAPIRVLLADDHTVVRQGLVSLLEAGGECEVVAQAADGLQAVAEARRTRPQVAVLDLGMPGLNGLEAVRRIHAELPAVRILVLTVHDEQEYVLPVVRAGAAGSGLRGMRDRLELFGGRLRITSAPGAGTRLHAAVPLPPPPPAAAGGKP